MLAEKHTSDEGVKISIKHFLDIFEEIGVKKIKTVGMDFNPETMEAVATIAGEEGKVLEEVKAGYTLFDSILRPAQVLVGKEQALDEAAGEV
jgi:molecular chaperone GrpE